MQDKQTVTGAGQSFWPACRRHSWTESPRAAGVGFAVVLGLGLALSVPGSALAQEPRPVEQLGDGYGLKVFEAAGCEPANVVCLDGDGVGLPRNSDADRDRLPANLDQGESVTIKVVGCAARYANVEFDLTLVGGPKREQLFRAEAAAGAGAEAAKLDGTPAKCSTPSEFTVLSSIVLEVPASSSVELKFKRKAVDSPPLPSAEQVHVARVLRPLYFLDVSVAAPFVIGGKRKVSSRIVPDLDGSVLTLEEDLRVSPAVMLHVFPGGRRLGAISSFSGDRACVRMQGADVNLREARTKRDAEKAKRDRALSALDQVKSELKTASDNLKAADKKLAAATIKQVQAQASLDEVAGRLAAATAEQDAAQTKLGAAKKSKAKASAQAELDAARAKVEKAQTDKAAAELSLSEAAAALTNATDEQQAAQRQVSDWQRRLAPAQRDRDAAQKPLDQAEAEVTAAEAERCRHLRRARYAANSLGVQLGVGLDLANFGDEFYSGLFFEPVTGLNFGVGMAIIKGDQLNPGYALGQIVDPTQLGAYASERYMIRPYVGISVSFDIIRNIRAASKAPEVTKLDNG